MQICILVLVFKISIGLLGVKGKRVKGNKKQTWYAHQTYLKMYVWLKKHIYIKLLKENIVLGSKSNICTC